MTGKQKCETLRQLRRCIASANGIVYLSAECTYSGECGGYCEKCEAEAKHLNAQLNRLAHGGKKIIVSAVDYQSVWDKVDSFTEHPVAMLATDMAPSKTSSNRELEEIVSKPIPLTFSLEVEASNKRKKRKPRLSRRTPVKDLSLSTDSTLLLINAGIRTVKKLLEYTKWDLLLLTQGEEIIENLCEIETKLDFYGLKLKEDPIEKLTIDYMEET